MALIPVYAPAETACVTVGRKVFFPKKDTLK